MEHVSLEFRGGPQDGRHFADIDHWPPADAIDATLPQQLEAAGIYVRTSYSQLPLGMPGIMRGAVYEWWPIYKWQSYLEEVETWDPDESTYPVHTFTPSIYIAAHCATCGRAEDAPRGTLGRMHLSESEARAMDGDR